MRAAFRKHNDEEIWLIDVVNQTGLAKLIVVVIKLLLWQQTLTCSIMEVDFLQKLNLCENSLNL